MIAVVGRIAGARAEDGGHAGLAGTIAVAAAARGSRVELVGKLGDDPAGDAALFALTRAGVGHAAVLRDPARPTPIVTGPPTSAAADDEPDEASPGDLLEPGRGPEPPGPEPGLDLAPGDLELALSYITEATVIVLADASPSLVPIAVDGAAFAGAALVILGDARGIPTEVEAPGATVLAIPPDDPNGTFASLVAEYAIGLDEGREPAVAWDTATRRLGAEPA